ncbi:MFS transporter, partial [Staphylococcus sp. 5313]
LVQSTQLYYFKYVLDKPNLVGLVSTLNFIVLLPALFATTFISKKLGKKYTALIGIGGFVIFEVLNFLFFGENYVMFLVMN